MEVPQRPPPSLQMAWHKFKAYNRNLRPLLKNPPITDSQALAPFPGSSKTTVPGRTSQGRYIISNQQAVLHLQWQHAVQPCLALAYNSSAKALMLSSSFSYLKGAGGSAVRSLHQVLQSRTARGSMPPTCRTMSDAVRTNCKAADWCSHPTCTLCTVTETGGSLHATVEVALHGQCINIRDIPVA